MADNKLNYQQARKVRKASISDLLLDQLAQQESVGKAIRKTISLKSQARIKGIKEKFDPLNIIRFMTFGSRFAPALYGKLTGRNQRDIDYFTGRTKSIVSTKNTADRIKKTPGEGDSEAINEQLSKIYSFLKNSREEDVKLKELAKNTEEEIALEKQKRHKELIDTLNKLVKSINSGGGTAEQVKESSFLDDMWAKLRGLADLVGLLRTTIIEMAKKIGMPVARALSSAGRWAVNAASAFAASGAATVTAVGVGGALLAYGATNVLENMSDEQLQQLSEGDVGSDTSIAAAAILSGRQTPKEREDAEKKSAKLKELLKDAPFLTRVYNVGVRDYLRNEKKLSKKEVDDLIGPSSEPEPTAEPVKKKENAVPQAPEGQVFDAEGNLIAGPRQTAPVLPKSNPSTSPASTSPMPSVPSSAPVSNLSKNNVELNLPNTVNNTGSVVNKTINNVKAGSEKSGMRPIEISVRNLEPTFMDLIVDSTRMI